MAHFLQRIAEELVKDPGFLHKTIVLPSKRSGIFLKKAIIEKLQKPVISPKIITIDEFIEQHSPFQKIDWLPLLFEFYQVYRKTYKEKTQKFDEFLKWAPYILQDFNELDTFSADAKEVFTYILEVKKIGDWELKDTQPKLVKDYLQFYASLYDLYRSLNQSLSDKKLAYQGMIYKYVAEHIEEISNRFKQEELFFCGFNALSKTEEKIFKHLAKEKKAKIFWDADQYYLKPEFEASLFLRKYQKEFDTFNWIFDEFSEPKQIEIIGVPSPSTQAQVIADIIQKKISTTTANVEDRLLQTAVVLNDNNLLIPIINSLPENLSAVNITLGLPIGQLPLTQFFEQIIKLYYELEQFNRFNLDTIAGLMHQTYLEQIIGREEFDANQKLLEKLSGYRTKMIVQKHLFSMITEKHKLLKQIFIKDFDVKRIFEIFSLLIKLFGEKNISDLDKLALVRLEKIFDYLKSFVLDFDHIRDMKTFQILFRKLLRQERLSFEGEPLEGLQIMGILETRLLDFNHLIITSMNEGVIPKGKSEHSIIPFELKRTFGLPMHREQTSVIAYHFYRLLQRAKHITLLYSTDISGLGSTEQSRFITQLKNELDTSIHQISKKQLKLNTTLDIRSLERVEKTPEHIRHLQDMAKEKGFSPSAMTLYIKNPIEYYKRYILRLEEVEEIVEGIPANVFGNIVHNALDKLYSAFEGKQLDDFDIDQMLKTYETVTTRVFIEETYGKNLKKVPEIEGKNLIALEVIKKNIKDLILVDKALLDTGNILEILSVEEDFKVPITIAEDRDVFIRGKVDRIDRLNGQVRVIDYKTGNVNLREITIKPKTEDLTDILENPDKSKLFQLLTYAWLFYHAEKEALPYEVGILSTRKIKKTLLKGKPGESSLIDSSILDEFESLLKKLLNELFDPKTAFVEKQE